MPGLFDRAIRGVWGWLGGITGWWSPSPDKPTIPGQSFDAWAAQIPDGSFIAVHQLESKDDAASDGIEAAENGYWGHIISGKYGSNCFEAIEPCFSLSPLSKYNDPKKYQLVAFVADLTPGEVVNLRMFYAGQLGKPYPIREIVHDAFPPVPGVNDDFDCSGGTSKGWQKCVPRIRIFPAAKDSRPQDVFPQEIYNTCEPQTAVFKMLPWNVKLP